MALASVPPAPAGGLRPAARTLATVAGVALAAGFLTAYAQEWLPAELGFLANSAGSWTLIAFGLALLAGPVIGAAAHWLAVERGRLAAIGAGVVAGVLIGGGAYGLAFIADTTYPPYWWGEVLAGAALLVGAAIKRLARPADLALALAAAAASATALVALYRSNPSGCFPRAPRGRRAPRRRGSWGRPWG